MPSDKKGVHVRLDNDELKALRRLPGASDSERLRSLLHESSLTQSIARQIDALLGVRLERSATDTRQKIIAAIGEKIDTAEKASEKRDDTIVRGVGVLVKEEKRRREQTS